MKITCIQMDTILAQPEINFAHAKELIAQAAQQKPDVILLPETWNVGFIPKDNLPLLSQGAAERTKTEIGALAKQYNCNIIAGSVADTREGKVFNTALVFDRQGRCIASYDKTHLFTPAKEHHQFEAGCKLCSFELDGVPCALITCYEVRFPELARTHALNGVEILFMVSQWPDIRVPHLKTLTTARAIENQMFLAYCNGCGTAYDTKYGGTSGIIDPWGNALALAGEHEELITATCAMDDITEIRGKIDVFADRRPDLYNIK